MLHVTLDIADDINIQPVANQDAKKVRLWIGNEITLWATPRAARRLVRALEAALQDHPVLEVLG